MELIVEKINNIEDNEIKTNFDLNNLKEDDLNQIDKILKEKIENYTETNDNINYIKSILIDINKEKNKYNIVRKDNSLLKLINNYKEIKLNKVIFLLKKSFDTRFMVNDDKLNDLIEHIFNNNKLDNEILEIWKHVNKKITNKNTFNKLINKLESKIDIIFLKNTVEIDKDELKLKLKKLDYVYDNTDIFNDLKLKRGFISVFLNNNTKYILKYQPNKSYMENIINIYLNNYELSKKYILFPKIIYVCKSNSYFYLIEKYDNDLFKYLNLMENQLSEKEIFKIIYFIIKALKFIHSKGIIYSDLKLENIVIKLNNGKISGLKLIDFDVSLFKELPEKLETYDENIKKLLLNDKTRGTKIYMLKSEKMTYDNDIYSLGVITLILFYKNIIHIINKEKDNLDKNLYVKLKKKLKNLKGKIEDDDSKKDLINYLVRILKNRRFKKYWNNEIINIDFFRKFINDCITLNKNLDEIYCYFKDKKFY